MKGLILNQIYTMRKVSVLYAAILAAYYLLGVFGKGLFGIQIFAVFFSAMLIINSFSYEEKCGWSMYVNVLPVSRKQIVLSKYLLAFIFIGAVTAGGAFLQALVNIKNHAGIGNGLWVSAAAFLGASFFLSILVPLLFKLGTEKSRAAMVIIFLIPFCAVMFIEKAGLKFHLTSEVIKTTLPFLAVGIILMLAASVFMAIHIYEGKEF